MAQVTKGYINSFIANQPEHRVKQFIGRALVVLFNNQTEDEKRVNDTNQDNGIGFTGADARSGTLTAKYFLKHRTLLDWQVEMWTKPNARGTLRIAKYWRQLDDAATKRAASKNKPRVGSVKPPVVEDIGNREEARMVQAEINEAEREMDRMVHEAELEGERRAFQAKMDRDIPKWDTFRRRSGVNPTAARRAIRGAADPRSL